MAGGIELDLDELGAIKSLRAVHDPVIVYESTEDYAPENGGQIYDDIQAARLQQNSEIPVEDRIEYATWPETVVYFSTLTMDEKYVNRDVKELYQFSFRKYLGEWSELEPDDFTAPLDSDPDLESSQRNRLGDLRYGIKKDRDLHFVNSYYEELSPESVPKNFWLTDYERSQERSWPDSMAQSAIDDYTD